MESSYCLYDQIEDIILCFVLPKPTINERRADPCQLLPSRTEARGYWASEKGQRCALGNVYRLFVENRCACMTGCWWPNAEEQFGHGSRG